MQAYGPIFMANQTMATDLNASQGQRARRRAREDEDDEDDEMQTDGPAEFDQDSVQRVPQWGNTRGVDTVA